MNRFLPKSPRSTKGPGRMGQISEKPQILNPKPQRNPKHQAIWLVFWDLVILWALGFGGFESASAAPPRDLLGRVPNVVFILSDDQRADTIHALGNKHIRTPNLDRLV